MNKYLITGGSGFIGTSLVEYHLARGDEVMNIDIAPPRNGAHRQAWKNCNILDSVTLDKSIAEFSPNHIYHLAARTDLNGKTRDDYAANIAGVESLIAALRSLPHLQNVIFASSRLVCTIGYQPQGWDDYCPTTAYGASKVEGEKIVKALPESAWTWSLVRPTSIWGPWFGVPYRNFFDSVRTGLYIHPRAGNIYKSFGFVGNSVHQLVQLMHAPRDLAHRQGFYLGDYEPIEVLSFANLIAKNFNKKNVLTVPMPLLRIPAFIGDNLQKIGMNFPLTSFRLDNLITPMIHDFDNLKLVVGPLPFSLEEGVRITTDWMKADKSNV